MPVGALRLLGPLAVVLFHDEHGADRLPLHSIWARTRACGCREINGAARLLRSQEHGGRWDVAGVCLPRTQPERLDNADDGHRAF